MPDRATPDRLRIVVLGIAGRTPFAGVAWQVMHYLEGLRRLGHEVAYVEDTGTWPYDPERNTVTDDPGYTLRWLAGLMARCHVADWAYVAPGGRPLGPAAEGLPQLLAGTDALINLTGTTVLREEHLGVPVRIYLETDPVGPQVEIARGRKFTIDLLAAHTHHASFGERLHAPDCGVPVERFAYLPTRQPVVLDWWPAAPDHAGNGYARDFTTVASWRQAGRDVIWGGRTYHWSKDREFARIMDLPQRSRCSFELALACDDHDALRTLAAHGWRVVDGLELSRETTGYRRYIRGSRGELTVAKDQNVRLRSGWFSDRSATYLAAGRPVVTQDTGFGAVLPTGAGLFAFRTMDDILTALDAIEADYAGHRRAAREIAREHFAAERVLSDLLDRCAGDPGLLPPVAVPTARRGAPAA
jgi:hypothetical protein